MADDHPRASEGRDRAHDARMVSIGVVVVLLVWFALINTESVDIHFWIFSTRAPVIVVVVIAGLLGALIGALVARRRRRR